MKTLRHYIQTLLFAPEPPPPVDAIHIGNQRFAVIYRRHPRAKNYILRLKAGGTVVVTLPWRGSIKHAREFVFSRKPWLEKQWKRLQSRPQPPRELRPGMTVLLDGQPVEIQAAARETGLDILLGGARIPVPSLEGDLRPHIQAFLQNEARAALPLRVEELAREQGAVVRRVTIRDQKSRWGSCSRRGTISLNWRLIQTPASVRDYIILHELAHLRHPNHSPAFWAEVGRVCPEYRKAEAWLKANSGGLGFFPA